MSRYSNKMDFLSRHIVRDEGAYNHVLLTPPFGKYLIDLSDPDKRRELHAFISDCMLNNIDLGLCEVHDDTIPEALYFDIDISLKEARGVSMDVMRNFCRSAVSVFSEYLESPNMVAYIMKKADEYEMKGNKWHVGFHVEFPEIRCFSAERHVLYRLLIKKLEEDGVFDGLPLEEERVDEIVDNRVISKNAIIMYGCNKSKKSRYLVREVFHPEEGFVSNSTETTLELMNILSIHRARWEPTIPTEFRCNETFQQLRQEFLPAKKKSTLSSQAKTNSKTPSVQPLNNVMDVDTEVRVKKLLSILSPSRCETYDSWIQVSLCLHNISDSQKMYALWKEWSMSGCPEKADSTNFQRLWEGFQYKEQGLKMGSLTLWAKEDSPDKFLAFKMEEIEKKIKRTIDEDTSYDIAKVLREMYDGIFVCSSIRNKTWYEFRKHSYVEIQEGYTLFINISEQLVHEYEKKMAVIYSQLAKLMTDRNSSDAKDYEKQLNDIKELIRRLKDATFKSKIMVEARNLFYDEEFEKKLNEQRHLIVFKNGVYDLDRQEFRSGRPEDYMSFTTGISYREYEADDEDILRVRHIIREIHPKEDNFEFFMTVLAAGLHGTKKEQKLDIWTGTGSNGKSIMIDFLAKALGDYYECPSITMLTRRRQSSSNASPDLAKLKGRRIVSFLEPEYDDTLHTSIIKQFFGNDWIEARALYREPIKFKAQASGFLSCNDLPKIPCNDGGTWRRLRVLEFKSKFVQNPKQPFEKKIDIRLPDQIDGLSESFMSLLIHYYKIFINVKKGVVTEPQDVRDFTERWQRESNLHLEFITEFIRDSNDPKSKVTEKLAFETFRHWCKTNADWFKPNKHELKKQMTLQLGEPKKNIGWVGKKLITPGEDDAIDQESFQDNEES